jgi:hypothetical protein
MQQLEGYTIEKCLRQTPRAEVWAAIRDRDGTPVELKLYRGDVRQSGKPSRAERELRALERLAGPGIPRPIDVDLSCEQVVLVLHRVPGISLDALVHSRRPALAFALDICAKLADIAWRIHTARMLHLEIKPSHIVVDPESRQVHLVDFARARAIGGDDVATELRISAALLDETLRYIAPEQSGRMARGIDARSDLYALGATFYFVLTGRAPFESRDPLELIHSHIARQPAAPTEIDASIPTVLSGLVLKLLRKQPEERYQNARALHADLCACQAALAATGSLDGLTVSGDTALPDRPLFRDTLYGREREIAIVREAYARAVQGSTEVLLLSGPPGVGKSALAAAVRQPLLSTGGYLAHAKLDPSRRDEPHAGLADALRSLVDQWLTESTARLRMWGETLGAALGSVAGALVELVPELGIVVGDVASSPTLGSMETAARLSLAVQRFVCACATTAHPLVLCLDDLHWADAGTLDMLDAVLRSECADSLLVIGTCDDEEAALARMRMLAEGLRTRTIAVQELRVESLSLDATTAMLADALGRSTGDLAWLTACVERKTGNIPVVVRSFIDLMHDRGWLVYETGVGWVWDEAAIASADVPEDAVALVAKRIEQLAPAARAALAFASCLGDTFTAQRLALFAARDVQELDAALGTLCDAGLVSPCRSGLRFSHDRIREAAASLLPPEARVEAHHRAGRTLLQRAGPATLAECAPEIADHLNRATALLSDNERPRLVAVNVLAARRAMRAGSAAIAEGYLAAGRALVRDSDWEEHAEQCFELFLESARCALSRRAVGVALHMLDALEPRARGVEARTAVDETRIRAYAASRPYQETAELTLRCLAHAGLRFPLHPSRHVVRWSLLRAGFALRNLRREHPPGAHGSSAVHRARMEMLSAGASAIGAFDRRLALVTMAWRVRESQRRGYVIAPGAQLLAHAAYAFSFHRDLAALRRLADVGAAWSEKLDDPTAQVRAKYVLHVMIVPWFAPRMQSAAALRELVARGGELGDTLVVEYAALSHARMRLLSGALLAQAEREHRDLAPPIGEMAGNLIALLIESGDDAARVGATMRRLRALPERSSRQVSTVAMLVLYVLRAHAEMCEVLAHMAPDDEAQVFGTFQAADICLYRGLAASASAAASRGRSRRRHMRTLRRNAKSVRGFAAHGPDFEHMVSLLSAEIYTLRGRRASAVALYQQSALRAERLGYIHHAAIAHERRADVLFAGRRETQAREALRDAARRYHAWGAHAKVQQLAHRITHP